MRDPHTIIRRPLITEKSTFSMDRSNAYVFEIDSSANRIEVKSAVEEIWEVKVKKVNTLYGRSKRRRVGRSIGFSKVRKKAVVTLMPGHTIDLL